MMRTVVCHFYNEEYLLPWWLKHHREIFDHGIMIDHGSNDRSVEIVSELAPSWRIVRSTLTNFDAFLTDFEVMQYERDIPGWKIVLNVTEFLMSKRSLSELEQLILNDGRTGFSLSGMYMVDSTSNRILDPEKPLPTQCVYGIDDNFFTDPKVRGDMGLPGIPLRNRFYHCHEVGMYSPGRHFSWHKDYSYRVLEAMIFYFAYAPWNDEMKRRRLQSRHRIPPMDLAIGWGTNHTYELNKIEQQLLKSRPYSSDLREHKFAGPAIAYSCSY